MKVVNISNENEILVAEFHTTEFYPGGGGQPCDTGKIWNESFQGEVTQVSKKGNAIIHQIRPIKGELNIGDEVDFEIDQNRRSKLTKMHTGEHILYKSLERFIPDIKLEKINLDEKESSLYVAAKEITWNHLFKAEELANNIIAEDHKLNEKIVSKKDIDGEKGLRIKLDRIKAKNIRIIEIVGFDRSACTGTHLDSTKEVKNLLITRFNSTHGKYEIRFKVDCMDELFNYSKIARANSSLLETDINNTHALIYKMIQDNEEYKEKWRSLQKDVEIKSEKIGDIELVFHIFDDFEKKPLIKKANSYKENTIVCFINKTDKATILLRCTDDLDHNIPGLLKKILDKFEGKGGGRNKFAMGSVELKYADKIKDELVKDL